MELLDIQKKVKEFTKEKGIDCSVEARMLDISSEVGELSKEVLKGTDYGNKQFEITEEWTSEIGDILFSLICIANKTSVNLEDSLKLVLDKYEKRFKDKGSIGSEVLPRQS